jgi:hypothetical protein
VTLIKELEHQHAHESTVRRGNMDIEVVPMNLTYDKSTGIHVMGL